MKSFLLLLFLIPFTLSAQTLPVDSLSGKYFLAEEVLVKDAPRTDLYNRAKKWFKKIEKNQNILATDDPANGLFIVNSGIDLVIQQQQLTRNYQILFKLKLEMEDDRYWYSLSDFKCIEKPASKSKVSKATEVKELPLEKMLLAGNGSKEKEWQQLVLKQINLHLSELIENLKADML